jgi:hypothetical protein
MLEEVAVGESGRAQDGESGRAQDQAHLPAGRAGVTRLVITRDCRDLHRPAHRRRPQLAREGS